MIEHKLFLIGGDDDEPITFFEDGGYGQCKLRCEYRDKKLFAEATDFFEALCSIRIELEKDQLIPYCYGSSLNVYPSRMSREMSAGKSAYKLQIGRQSSKQDLVGIFNQGPDIIPASVSQQKEYFDGWIASERI
jgi:hypothetical protein